MGQRPAGLEARRLRGTEAEMLRIQDERHRSLAKGQMPGAARAPTSQQAQRPESCPEAPKEAEEAAEAPPEASRAAQHSTGPSAQAAQKPTS